MNKTFEYTLLIAAGLFAAYSLGALWLYQWKRKHRSINESIQFFKERIKINLAGAAVGLFAEIFADQSSANRSHLGFFLFISYLIFAIYSWIRLRRLVRKAEQGAQAPLAPATAGLLSHDPP
jgi:hypothetical protein